MTDARIEIVGGEELRRAMRDPEFVRGPATDFVRKAAFEIQARAVELAPSNFGRLRNSITVDVKSRPFSGDVTASVGSNLKYAAPVEFGSKPHWPPLAPILLWTRRKLHPPARQARSIAFLIQRKIARHGTPAQPYLSRALRERTRVIEFHLSELGREIERRFSR